jgi:hypothetical protein
MPKPVISDRDLSFERNSPESECTADATVLFQHIPSIEPTGSASFSLTTMFQILTACCIFFAVLNASPLLAIIGTLVMTPAIIRTAMAAELYQKHGLKFNWTRRVRCFLESTGLTVVTYALSATVFALISLAFGLICVAASFVMGISELATDIAFVGTAGGMIWGVAGGILAFGLCVRKWQLDVLPKPTKPV